MMQSGFESGSMMIASLLVARWFGAELFGVLAIMTTGVQLVTNVTDGFPVSIIRFVSARSTEAPGQSDDTSRYGLGWQLAWFATGVALATAVVIGGIGWALSGFSADIKLIVLSVLLATMRAGRSMFDALFRAVRSFRAPTVYSIVCTGLMAATIIGFAAYGAEVAAYLLISTIFTGLITFLLGRNYKKTFSIGQTKRRLDPEVRDAFLKYSYPLLLRGLTAFLFLKVNIWIIGGLASASDAGQFRLAEQFLTISALVFSAIVTAIAPRIAEAQSAGTEQLSLLCARMYGLMLAIGGGFCLLFSFNGLILPYLFPGFQLASIMLAMFAPAVVFRGMANASSLLLTQGGKPKAAFWLSFLPSVANISAAFGGYYFAGVMGLVASTAIVHLLTYIISLIIVHRLFKLPFRIKFS